MKNYSEDSDKEYFFEVDVKRPKQLHKLRNDFSFLLERMRVNKCENFVCNLNDKERLSCCTHKNVKTSTKLLISIAKTTWSN